MPDVAQLAAKVKRKVVSRSRHLGRRWGGALRRWRGGAGAVSAGVDSLPGTIEYDGEFGPELVLFLPWCTWLSRQGLLRGRRLRIYRGMRCFYDDLDCAGIEEKDTPRQYLPPAMRMMPVRCDHTFDGVGRSPFLLHPDLRSKFRALPLPAALDRPARPLLVIHNKHNQEWGGAPVNFIPVDVLDETFGRLTPEFTVVYIRHGMRPPDAGYSDDETGNAPFDEGPALRRHPEVLVFDELFEQQRGTLELNAFKAALLSRCHLFLTVQGGGTSQLAMFSGSLLVVLHRRGRETELAYGHGYYGFVANPAPIRAVCTTLDELREGVGLFAGCTLSPDRVLVPPAHAGLLERLSPFRPFTAQPAQTLPEAA